MKFGEVDLDEALGGILVHAIRRPSLTIKKGELLHQDHLVQLKAVGIQKLTIARLEDDDSDENTAAELVAEALIGPALSCTEPFTGRCNIHAERAGILKINADVIDRVNLLDERLTIATLPAMSTVKCGTLVATVKIIPFAVPRSIVAKALALLDRPPLVLAPFIAKRVAMISTVLPGLKSSVISKTAETLSARLERYGSRLVRHEQCTHEFEEVHHAIIKLIPHCDILVIFGASAISDRRDIIPKAIVKAGGTVVHYGMPVDPGNLLLLTYRGQTSIIGAPGCARSPKENGFDFILSRLLADIRIESHDIQKMGVGGLLSEIESRPQLRTG